MSEKDDKIFEFTKQIVKEGIDNWSKEPSFQAALFINFGL